MPLGPIRLGRPFVWLATLLAVPAAARGDQLDVRLNEAMPDVVAQLKKKGYKNVATLSFHVKPPGKAGGYHTALSASLATRVETLLVIHGGPTEKDALGVIHDAGRVARAAKVGAWPTLPAERKKLFTLDYPLAWGKAEVRADVFLTGQVEVSKDLRTTTLRLQAFDRRSDKPVLLKTIVVETDRQVVRDLGYRVAMDSRSRTLRPRDYLTLRRALLREEKEKRRTTELQTAQR